MVPDEYYCEECQPEDHPYIDSKPRSQVVSKQQQQQRAGAKKGTSNNSGNNGSRRRNSSSIDDDESEKTPPMPTVKEERAQSKKSRRLTTQETIELDSANEGDGGDEPVVEDIVAVMLGATPKRPYASRVLSNRRDVPSADKPNAANETELSDGTKNPTVDFEHSNSMGLIMSPTKRRKTGRNGGGSSGGSNSGSSTPRSKGRGGRNGRRGPDQAGSHTEASSKDNNLKPADRDSEDDCGGEGDTLEDARSEANTVLSAELISPTFLTNSLSDQRQAEGSAGGDSRTLKGNTGGARRSGTKGHASAQGTPVGRDSQSRASHSRPPSVMTHASFDLAAAEWPADQNLDRVQQLTSTNREGLPLYTSNEPSACRIRYPSPNATLADFTHRAKEMLEWVGKVQSEYLEEQSRWREALAIYRERRGMPHPADMSFSRESTARATPDVHAPMTVLSPHDGQRLQQQEEPSVTEESPSSMSYHKLPPPPSEASTDPVDPSEWPEIIGEFEERSLPKRSVSQPASPTHRPLMGAIQEVKTRTKRAHTIILSPAEAQVPQLNAPPIVPQPQHTDIAYQRGSKNEPLNVTEQQEPKGDDEELASGGNRREDASDEEDNSTLYMLESLVCRLIKFQETYAT
ncbi:hypothetical protein EV182_000952 [Spiromyces aspiralis]|uniref:Uncharacterized protein n=1 Tax=Spiromyces aspiralis TaxID=68401 RepID=A0ACC1HTS4_9FUNG|nr:hypothetical protein EV182_000952 [Spiromyces aspiralis]